MHRSGGRRISAHERWGSAQAVAVPGPKLLKHMVSGLPHWVRLVRSACRAVQLVQRKPTRRPVRQRQRQTAVCLPSGCLSACACMQGWRSREPPASPHSGSRSLSAISSDACRPSTSACWWPVQSQKASSAATTTPLFSSQMCASSGCGLMACGMGEGCNKRTPRLVLRHRQSRPA